MFREDFQNTTSTTPVPLVNYRGARGEIYTADGRYLINCNGEVVNFNMTALPGNCSAGPYGMAAFRPMARALGELRGFADPATNNALSAYTDTGNNFAKNPCPVPVGLAPSPKPRPSCARRRPACW